MTTLRELLSGPELAPLLRSWLPFGLTLLGTASALAITHTLARLREGRTGRAVGRQVAMLVVTALGIVALVLALPVGDALKNQLFGLLGLALTGVLAFSSTTFVANAMAGLMLRAVGNFRPGDWLAVGDQFGRVTERGLFHTEIQTEDRDLATLPNLYLVTHPVKVVAESGTIVSTQLSLGYDLDHREVEARLLEAAGTCGLEEPFVQVLALGDFAVTYRVAGFLREVKHLLSVRSRLQASVLDALHGAGMEIVSPTFMNQRRLDPELPVLPLRRTSTPPPPEAPPPEERIFDKAEERASLEGLRAEREELQKALAGHEEEQRKASDTERETLDAEIARVKERIAALDTALAEREGG